MRNAMEVLGLSEFMENRLIYGRDKDKLRVIQAARLLDMQLPDSVMASFVNNRDVRLHKAARFYYMLINKDDPYLFFENDKMNDQFSVSAVRDGFHRIWHRPVAGVVLPV